MKAHFHICKRVMLREKNGQLYIDSKETPFTSEFLSDCGLWLLKVKELAEQKGYLTKERIDGLYCSSESKIIDFDIVQDSDSCWGRFENPTEI